MAKLQPAKERPIRAAPSRPRSRFSKSRTSARRTIFSCARALAIVGRIRFPILLIRVRLAPLLLLLAILAVPATAGAATYVVNETGNISPDVGCQDGGGAECDLWEAIDLSNLSTGVRDTIEFEVAEVAVNTALP